VNLRIKNQNQCTVPRLWSFCADAFFPCSPFRYCMMFSKCVLHSIKPETLSHFLSAMGNIHTDVAPFRRPMAEPLRRRGRNCKVLEGSPKTYLQPNEYAYLCACFTNTKLFTLRFPADLCGDHVVVINCKHVALPGNEWRKRVFFHHNTYPGGATWTPAWEMQTRDPTMVSCFICRKNLKSAYFA
jgi:hypothetical protein